MSIEVEQVHEYMTWSDQRPDKPETRRATGPEQAARMRSACLLVAANSADLGRNNATGVIVVRADGTGEVSIWRVILAMHSEQVERPL